MRGIKSVFILILIFCLAFQAEASTSLCQDAFALVKAKLNSSLTNSKRKVGLELEFANADYAQVLQAVASLTQGKIKGLGYLKFDQKFRPEVVIDKFPRGEHHGFKFSMRTLENKKVSGRYRPSYNLLYIENHIFSVKSTAEALTKVHGIFAGRIPFVDSFSVIENSVIGRIQLIRDGRNYELITDPLKLSQLKYFTEIYEMLIAMGVKGVEHGHAAGLHINVSVGYKESRLIKNLVLTWNKNSQKLRARFNPSQIRDKSYGSFSDKVVSDLLASQDPSLQDMARIFDAVYSKGLDLNVKTVLSKEREAVEARLADAQFSEGAPQRAEELIRSTVDLVDKVDRFGVFEIQ